MKNEIGDAKEDMKINGQGESVERDRQTENVILVGKVC